MEKECHIQASARFVNRDVVLGSAYAVESVRVARSIAAPESCYKQAGVLNGYHSSYRSPRGHGHSHCIVQWYWYPQGTVATFNSTTGACISSDFANFDPTFYFCIIFTLTCVCVCVRVSTRNWQLHNSFITLIICMHTYPLVVLGMALPVL